MLTKHAVYSAMCIHRKIHKYTHILHTHSLTHTKHTCTLLHVLTHTRASTQTRIRTCITNVNFTDTYYTHTHKLTHIYT